MKKQIEGQISLFDYIAEEEQNKQKEEQKTALSPVSLFKQCKKCWCSDCSHNEKLSAIPRDFAGVKRACPSCVFCLQNKKAEICEIGSYENGCKLRASVEGISPEEI